MVTQVGSGSFGCKADVCKTEKVVRIIEPLFTNDLFHTFSISHDLDVRVPDFLACHA